MRQLTRYDTWYMGLVMAFVFMDLVNGDFLLSAFRGSIMFGYIVGLDLIERFIKNKKVKE